jgi:phosphotransferase system, enzyme I, PtsP
MLANLGAIIQAVNAAHDLRETYDIIVERVQLQFDAKICSIFNYNEQTEGYRLAATVGLDRHLIDKLEVPSKASLVSLIADREEPLRLEHVQSHESFYPIPGIADGQAVTFLGIPILHHRQVLGVLVIQHLAPHSYSEDDEAFLMTLSAQLAAIIANANLRAKVEAKQVGALQPTLFKASSSAPGLAVGKGWLAVPSADLANVPKRAAKDTDAEIHLFRRALNKARTDIRKLAEQLANSIDKQQLLLFEAYQQLLSRKSLGLEVEQLIEQQQVWAAYALATVINQKVDSFLAMSDPYLQERATDIADLGQRVLSNLQSQNMQATHYPKNTILIAERVTSAMMAEVPKGRLQAIVSIKGSAASHAALLAKSLGIPALLGLRDCPLTALDGKTLIVNGYDLELLVRPSNAIKNEYLERIASEQQYLEQLQRKQKLKAITKDGIHIPLLVNTGMLAHSDPLPNVRYEGIGLYRTEYSFMRSERFPTEDEQVKLYERLLTDNKHKPVTIRTLDIGGDKQLNYFPIVEENPFLGWRGIRVTLDHPEIFLTQIKAMLKANLATRNLKIVLPMISTVSEVEESLTLINQAYQELLAELSLTKAQYPLPPTGVMIEVPAAIYQMPAIASKVDFFTIGTNDLTQYLFAVDRNNSRVAYLNKSLHPALLCAIEQICSTAKAHNKPIQICGEMAGDPLATMLLVAMEVDSLSMNLQAIPKVKQIIQQLELKQAKRILANALKLTNAYQVKQYMLDELAKHKLLRLVKPGAK